MELSAKALPSSGSSSVLKVRGHGQRHDSSPSSKIDIFEIKAWLKHQRKIHAVDVYIFDPRTGQMLSSSTEYEPR